MDLSDVEGELKIALEKIGDVLADTNVKIQGSGFQCVISSVRFVNFENDVDESWNVFLPPVDDEYTVEDYSSEQESSVITAIYLSDRSVTIQSVQASKRIEYVKGKKKIRCCLNEGRCCQAPFLRKLRCQDILGGGDQELWVCWRDPEGTCPENN